MRWCLLVILACVGCSAPVSPTPVEQPGLHNVYRVSPTVYSGSSPDGDDGFRSLQSLGVRTIISVDGSTPEVETAKQFRMRYVHLPIGYDGVGADRAAMIAKAIRDLPGPVYIHCHHGKHRGPAATMAALRCLDAKVSAEVATTFLRTAGTDPKYAGLYADADRSPPTLDAASCEFPEVSPVSDLTRVMVHIDEVWSRLKAKPTASDWALLREQYRETNRLTPTLPEGFRELLTQAEQAAEQADAKASATLCTKCHSQFRDVRR
jgi:protein tyrosine phosphatase (PTP) superfamily phosphohydrolase (DUF442 family)